MNILKRHSILYAEDESIVRMNIVKQLQHYFHTVHVAKDGVEALSLYTHQKPDILLLDINMPKKNGLEMAAEVRKENENIPILILTAYTQIPMLMEAVELNLTKYLVKPVLKSDLKEGLQKAADLLKIHKNPTIDFSDDFYWHTEKKELYRLHIPVKLTIREKYLMRLLTKSPKTTISHSQIMAEVWNDKFEDEISIDSVKNLITMLRKKLPQNTIQTHYGKGYSLTVQENELPTSDRV